LKKKEKGVADLRGDLLEKEKMPEGPAVSEEEAKRERALDAPDVV
jgi:hypothetical protein